MWLRRSAASESCDRRRQSSNVSFAVAVSRANAPAYPHERRNANTHALASNSDVYPAVCWPLRAALRITRDRNGAQVRLDCRMGYATDINSSVCTCSDEIFGDQIAIPGLGAGDFPSALSECGPQSIPRDASVRHANPRQGKRQQLVSDRPPAMPAT